MVSYSTALKAVFGGKGMQLPHWNKDVIIRAQYPDEHSKMTHPYLYAESYKDGEIRRVPWIEIGRAHV
jgi:hypothetical protein